MRNINQKIKELERYVKFYCRMFVERWDDVSVIVKKSNIFVFWHKVNDQDLVFFTIRKFPVEDIDDRINKYKQKIRYYFKNRHKNKEEVEAEKDKIFKPVNLKMP